MGWKVECVLVQQTTEPYFGRLPSYAPEKAVELLGNLFPEFSLEMVGLSKLEDQWVPRPSEIAFGAYEHGCVLSSLYDLLGCTVNSDNALLGRIANRFAQSSILAIELDSVTNLFGYKLITNGSLRRAYAGNAKDGVIVDKGELLQEERRFFEESEIRSGVRFFKLFTDGQVEEYTAAGFGEFLTFQVSSRFLGTPLDEFPSEFLTVGRFTHPEQANNI